jgi:hypothetical protein
VIYITNKSIIKQKQFNIIIPSLDVTEPLVYSCFALFKKDLINFPDFYFLYKFLEAIPLLNIDRILEKEDIEKLYFSGLDEKLVFKLDNFDKHQENPQSKMNFLLN